MHEFRIRRKLLNSVPLETERLLLRYISFDDIYDMYEYASLSEVTKYLLWQPHINPEATKGYIESLQKRYKRGLYGDWAVVLKSENKMIGTCGYANINSYDMVCEVGYVLSPFYRGCGYMSEAVSAILELSFEKLMFKQVRLRIMAENAPSRRLAERMGFQLQEIIPDEIEVKGRRVTIAHYYLSDEEYRKIKAAAN